MDDESEFEFSEDFYDEEDLSDVECENEDTAEVEDNEQVLSTELVYQHMMSKISQVSEVVKLPLTTVRILLNHFKWDDDKLIEAFFEKGKEEIFELVNLAVPKISSTKLVPKQQEECEICFLKFPSSDMTYLACGHRFCNSCWCQYLTTKIITDADCDIIRCPGFQCKELVDDDTVKQLITENKTQLRFKHLLTNSFVQCHRLTKWCPSPDCSNAVKVSMLKTRNVRCSCGHLFCFSCLEEWHDPVQCEQLKSWLKKCSDDSETLNWVHVNTKECPKCHAFIEKNGGCNHMTCRKCRHQFCWLCLQNWPHISCNRFKEGCTSNHRRDLERYLFYYNRYNNHQNSIKLERVLHEKVQAMTSDFPIEYNFLLEAVDILYKCRRTLMFTYIFGYYTTSTDNEKEIFEENQTDLENATERLSAYLEGEENLYEEIKLDFRQKVMDCQKYCDQRRRVLLQHVSDGNEQGTWRYSG